MKQLTDKHRGEICGILAMGGTRAVAAQYIGCSLGLLLETEQSDRRFARDLRQAEGRGEMLQLKNIVDVARDRQDWRASAWVLERRYPERYLRRTQERAALKRLRQLFDAVVESILAEIEDGPLRQRIVARIGEVSSQLQPQRGSKERLP
jgi:hypothetical protein